MSDNYVTVNKQSYSFTLWAVNTVRADVATWGMLTQASRTRIEAAIRSVADDVRPIARLAPTEVELTVAKVRGTLALLESLTQAVHSARKVMTDDRRHVLGLIARAKKGFRQYIQLDLFNP